MSPQTVLVTGANGFIGSAVCRAFSLAGWTTYGLTRSDKSAADLSREEVTPIIGSPADPSKFLSKLPAIDVIVSCSEDINNYEAHFKDVLSMIRQICAQRLKTKTQRQTGSEKPNQKPLVIFTSGCKDYGMTPRHGEPGLAPHTEDSPLRPPPVLVKRCESALQILTAYTAEFDCIVTRPTTLYGRTGSFYSLLFLAADQAKTASNGALQIPSTPDSILHGAHVDDVGAAYVAMATAPREVVAGQAYNISAHRYETLGEIMTVVEQVHGVKVSYVDSHPGTDFQTVLKPVVDFPQWVGSDKLRRDTGWTDQKPLFHEGYQVYRNAYNVAAQENSEQYLRVKRIANGPIFGSGSAKAWGR
ncbi:hypothetical protein A1O1_04992 [Capronia coronata CBS 617.96]|uniref:NAD-dependent epimerase/dehydratase domain-containing protein n=1 Tax=Capronia coronata CBS 617.96 TaxID=1182541 RepID=W9Z0K9_9EURO|nr:uncharacterized protein A1O1_04992 [Capronia coronata CBS 617.96]EXJ88064.1 hypothetical protein A1O1_04992 [Capronia coronata CBS 617.96]